MSNKWKLFGDVNFLEHHGILVRREHSEETIKEYPLLGSIYQALVCRGPLPEDETKIMVFLKTVDIDDWKDKADAIISEIGYDPDTPEEKAAAMADYDGLEPSVDGAASGFMYPEMGDYLIDRDEAVKWLRSLGITEGANYES